jgi:hypothetical protein
MVTKYCRIEHFRPIPPLRPSRPLRWMVLLFVAAFAGCSGGTPKHPTWTNATGAEQYERLMWQAIQDKRWTEVEHQLAPTFSGVNSSGQALDRAGWLELCKNLQLKDYSLGDLTVQPAGADMVVTYVVHFNAADSGRPAPANGLRVVSVWQEIKKGWVLIAQSQTPMAGSK